jgi:hypothetical protein
MLGATAASYDVFKDFNKHVLQKAVKEINEITDITVTTENIRKGRSVASIRFTVTEKNPHVMSKEDAELFAKTEEAVVEEVDRNQMFLDAVFTPAFVDIDDQDDPLALFASALPSDFTREQVELLRLLALEHMPFTVGSLEEKELWLHDFEYKKVKLMDATPEVHSPFAWLRRAIMEDWQ